MATAVTQRGDRTAMNEGNIRERWVEMNGKAEWMQEWERR